MMGGCVGCGGMIEQLGLGGAANERLPVLPSCA